MPGQLRADALCPVCGNPLDALVDESSATGVKRTYYHGKLRRGLQLGKHPKARRMLPCKVKFTDFGKAHDERWALETHVVGVPVPQPAPHIFFTTDEDLEELLENVNVAVYRSPDEAEDNLQADKRDDDPEEAEYWDAVQIFKVTIERVQRNPEAK